NKLMIASLSDTRSINELVPRVLLEFSLYLQSYEQYLVFQSLGGHVSPLEWCHVACQLSPEPPPDTGQRWPTTVNGAMWHATSACRSHISPRGSATSAEWVSEAYVAATSAADVA
ncbi:hypothetical protein Tco_0551192, partial [Tanacetum coccineum]